MRPQYSSYTPPVAQKPKSRFYRTVIVFVIMFLACAGIAIKFHDSNAKASAASASVPAIQNAELGTTINQIINSTNMQVGVSIVDIKTNTSYNYGLHDTPFEAASTGKLLSAALFLQQVEQHKTNFKEQVGDASAAAELKKMIIDSDNDAWTAFNAQLGHPALATYAQSLGMTNYDPDQNTITSDDLAILLTKLQAGTLLNAAHTRLLLSYMHQANETQFIAAAIPSSGVQFYHKAGYLADRAMDAAIIDNGRRPYALVIFTKDPSGQYDTAAGQQIFQAITTQSLKTFGS